MTIFHTEHDAIWRKEQKALKQSRGGEIVTMKCLERELQQFVNRGWTILTTKTVAMGFSTTYILQIDREALEARK